MKRHANINHIPTYSHLFPLHFGAGGLIIFSKEKTREVLLFRGLIMQLEGSRWGHAGDKKSRTA